MKILLVVLLFPLMLGFKMICPGGKHKCPDNSTCCELLNMTYGCCPLVNAVCCDDRIHCCPVKTICSVNMCIQSKETNTNIHLIQSNDIVCPNGEVSCLDNTTCCKSPPGELVKYDCCPMANAVCCKDGFHCCPSGTTCDLEDRKCIGDAYVTEIYVSRKKYVRPPL